MMLTPLIQVFRPSVCPAGWRGLLPHLIHRPDPVLAEQEHFRLKLAETPAEVAAAQKLRYRVFKQEQGRLAGCSDGIDRDRFDRYCRHLIVTEKERGRIVGTYRVLSGTGAAAAGGFYSEEEFEVYGLRQLGGEVCEVGRSCVDPEFRSGAVVALLWSGLGALRRRPEPGHGWLHRCRGAGRRCSEKTAFNYLFGCVSLEDRNPVAALALHEYFRRNGMVSARLQAVPRPGFELDRIPREEVMRYFGEHGKLMERTLPPLFRGYLKLGARICGAPAYDREFGTIDFLILLDMHEMPERYARRFLN